MVLEASTSALNMRSVRARSSATGLSLTMVLREYPRWLAYMLALLTIVAGVFSSMSSTWMNHQNAPLCKGCAKEPFVGAMLQTQQMFIAEMLALVVWRIDSFISRAQGRACLFEFVVDKEEYETATGHWWYWPWCAVCDFCATLMVNTAYQYTFAATVEMLRNFMVVMTALFQIIIIRKAVTVNQWLGVFIITLAMILTAIPALQNPADVGGVEATAARTAIGVILAIGGTTVQSLQLVIEELLFRKGRYPPLKAVGVEGITGAILSGIAWPIYQTTGAEDVTGSWYQLFHNDGTLLAIGIAYLPCGTIFNICGLGTTKLAGGLLRGVCFAVRAPLVWIVCMIVDWQDYDNYSLASALVFLVGFTVYCNFYDLLTGYPAMRWISRPISCFCTDPMLDDPPFRPDNQLQDTEAQLEDANPGDATRQPSLQASLQANLGANLEADPEANPGANPGANPQQA